MYRPIIDRLGARAETIAVQNGITDVNAKDAFRHAYSSAMVTYYLGEGVARALGDIVELRSNNDPRDMRMDLRGFKFEVQHLTA